MTKPLATYSLGCRLNAYETERMASLAGAGTVVVNTCAVTKEAVRQSRQTIRRAAKQHPGARIVVSGCASQLDPEGFSAMPEVARVIGNGEKLDPGAWAAPAPVRDVMDAKALPRAPAPSAIDVRAPLEVQNGCDHRCTFCIIPFGRGQARSKRPGDVAAEGRVLAEMGAKEIVLTGVDLTSYGPDLGDGVTLADTIEALLAATPLDVFLRLSSIDGAEVDDRLFPLLTEEPRVRPHLHLSLQSGDTMILKRMKRRHTREDAVDLCARLRAARPDIAFGADLIAGFPTETEEMFENSVRLVEDCGLAYVHVFPFSSRAGTPAARMPQLDRAVVKERAARLRAASDEALARHLDAKVGQTFPVLIEQIRDGLSLAKTPDFAEVTLEPQIEPGRTIPARIDRREGRGLIATPAKED